MMRKTMISAAALCAGAALCGVVPRYVWQVETSDPVERHWPMTYGGSYELRCQHLDHRAPMDLTGAAVVLHARTNGMESGVSWQATGSVMSAAGYVSVTVTPDTLLPTGLTSVAYVIAVTLRETNLLAAAGNIRLTGTGAGLNSAPLPSRVSAELWSALLAEQTARIAADAALTQAVAAVSAAVAALETNAVTRAGTNGWEVGGHGGLATTGDVAAAIAAMPVPSSDALRLVDPSGDWLQSLAGGTSTLWRVVRTYDQSRVDFTFGSGASVGEMLYPTNAVYEIYTTEGDGLIFPRVEVFPDAFSFELYMGPTGFGYTAGWKTGAVPPGGFTFPLVIEPYGSGAYGAPTGTLTVSWHLLSVSTNAAGTFATHADLLAAVAPLARTNAPTLVNPRVSGALSILNIMPTNLVGRVFGSNDVLYVEWGNQ